MTTKQSWSRAQNVCNKVSQIGETGNKSRKIMRKLSTTKEMRSRYTNKHIQDMTHKQCKRMVRSDISTIDKAHTKKMRTVWKNLPKERRKGTNFKKWNKENAHTNPVNMAFSEDIEFLFNSE